MTLEEAIGHILAAGQAMNEAYQKVLFDEFAIISLRDQEVRLVWYKGPRESAFAVRFMEETSSLRAEARNRLFSRPYAQGEFEFVMDGQGSEVEAFIVLGEKLYLACGNTAKTMPELSEDPLWLSAQVFFVRLSELYLTQTLELTEAQSGTLLLTY